MSSIGLRPSAYFGLRNGIQGNAFYITDDEIIYPVGCVLSIYSLTQHHQRFIRLQERHKTVTLITISPNRYWFYMIFVYQLMIIFNFFNLIHTSVERVKFAIMKELVHTKNKTKKQTPIVSP